MMESKEWSAWKFLDVDVYLDIEKETRDEKLNIHAEKKSWQSAAIKARHKCFGTS